MNIFRHSERRAFAIGMTILFCGCSSTHAIRSAASQDSFTIEKMNHELQDEDAVIEMRDGNVIAARDVTATHDSLSWHDERRGETSNADLRGVRRIIKKDHPRGALDGLELGFPIGGLVGVIIGSALHIQGTAESGSQNGGFGALVGLVLGGGTGLIFGPITGLVIGHSDIYEFPLNTSSDSLGTRR